MIQVFEVAEQETEDAQTEIPEYTQFAVLTELPEAETTFERSEQGFNLPQQQATATQTAIVEQAKQLQQQATDAAQTAARIARQAAITAAWGTLLAAGLIIGAATFGGNQAASTRRKIDAAANQTTKN